MTASTGEGRPDMSDLWNEPYVESTADAHTTVRWPDPPAELLTDPMFNAIWNVIKTWDVAVPEQYGGYCGATGNHAYAIYRALSTSEAAREAAERERDVWKTEWSKADDDAVNLTVRAKAAEKRVGELEAQRDYWKSLTMERPTEMQAVLDRISKDKAEIEADIADLTVDLKKKVSALSLRHAFESLLNASNAVYQNIAANKTLRARTEKAEAALAPLQALVDEARKALLFGIGAALNELAHKGLPLEWSPESGIGVMSAALGHKSFAETIEAVKAGASATPADLLNERLAEDSTPSPSSSSTG